MNQSEWAGIVEIVFVLGGALAFGIWQLVSVKREIRRDREKAAAKERGESG
jgi:hypothetical protein